MSREQVRRHLELEKKMGMDFLPSSPTPVSKGSPSSWEAFRASTLKCTRCRLSEKRTQVVFGVGSTTAPLMFIGEGPGEKEDLKGEPFVGAAGQLLTQTLTQLGISREQVYIANIVKCRPPGNRTPLPDEVESCMPYLQQQMDHIQPKLICTLGSPAMKALLQTAQGIMKSRGQIYEKAGRRILPTLHPAYILRNRSALETFEGDINLACREAGLI